MASSHLNWLVIRNNNCHLRKVRNVKQPFSTESNNLTNRSSFRYSGLVQQKTVGIEPSTDKKGFVVVTKKPRQVGKPNKSLLRTTLKAAGPRRPLSKLRRTLKKTNYRKDLTRAALVRASVILKSQRQPKKKTRGKKAE